MSYSLPKEQDLQHAWAQARKRGPAIYRLWTQPVGTRVVIVEDYLKATGEMTFLALALSWVSTAIFLPDVVRSNPLKDYVGYNNLCVGWDIFPSSLIGAIGVVAINLFAWNYASWDATRTRLYPPEKAWKGKLSIFADYWYAGICALLPLLFLLGPHNGYWPWHTFVFVQLIIGRFVCVLANYLESPSPNRSSLYFLIFYGFVSAIVPILYFIAILIYELEERVGEDPAIPWWFVMFFDYAWFLCLPLTTVFLPPAPVLIQRLEAGPLPKDGPLSVAPTLQEL